MKKLLKSCPRCNSKEVYVRIILDIQINNEGGLFIDNADIKECDTCYCDKCGWEGIVVDLIEKDKVSNW